MRLVPVAFASLLSVAVLGCDAEPLPDDADELDTGPVGKADGHEADGEACEGEAPPPIIEARWRHEAPHWSQQPVNTASPGAVYDEARDQLLMFGGRDFYDENLGAPTWVWQGGQWVEIASAQESPSRRVNYAMTWDPRDQRVLLFGGARRYGYNLADLWQWDGSAWSEIEVEGDRPTPRTSHAMAYDAARGRLVVFGGANGDGLLADTWEFDGTQWEQRGSAGETPLARHYHAMAYDADREVVVMYGGRRAIRQGNSNATETSEVWEWDGQTWTQRESGPPGRASASMVYDPTRHTMVVSGDVRGNNSSTYIIHDAWEWDGQGPWRQIIQSAGGGGCCFYHPNWLVFDRVAGQAVQATRHGLDYVQFDELDNGRPRLQWLGSAHSVFARDTFTLQLEGSDEDGQALTYSVDPLPPGATLDPQTGLFAWTPTPDQAGPHNLTFWVSDGGLCAGIDIDLEVFHHDYVGLPTGDVDLRSEHIVFNGTARERTRWGWTSRNVQSSVSCTVTGDNPGKLVVRCSSLAGISGWNPFRPETIADLDEQLRFVGVSEDSPVTTLRGHLEVVADDDWRIVIDEFEARFNANLYSEGSNIQGWLNPYP